MSRRALFPVAVLAAGLLLAFGVVRSRPEVEKRAPEQPVPVVELLEVAPGTHRFRVPSQGTVQARTSGALVSEVAGRIVRVAPSFAPGGAFAAGEPLLWLEDSDYRAAVARAAAELASARVLLAREQEEAAIALDEWQRLHGDQPAPALVRREPQMEQARAGVQAAQAALERAERDLDRTHLRAPYAGRVATKLADVGDYVGPGTPVARVYGTARAEILLPVPDHELAFLDIPLGVGGADIPADRRPAVELHTRFAGQDARWTGEVVRTGGQIDPQTRMLSLVAHVERPFAPRGDGPPMTPGLFVQATILGLEREDVYVLPRSALRAGDTLWLVDGEDRLSIREVQLLRRGTDEVVVQGELGDPARVVASPLEAPVDGMQLRVVEGGAAR